MEGDPSFTLSKNIIQLYASWTELNPMTAYYLKYFNGLNLKLVDSKKATKETAYVKMLL